MTALALPALMGAASLALDVGVWYREGARLQIAADAGAMGAARLLSAHTAGNSAYQAAALLEVNAVTGGQTVGTLTTPVTVSVAADWSTVTVTLTSMPDGIFAKATGLALTAITASATASATVPPPNACVLALGNNNGSNAILVNNMGSIVANGCPIFSNSSAAQSIYLDSGTITGTSIGAAGGVVQSNSGSNTLSPAGTSYATSEPDPFSALAVPSYGSCNYNNLNDTNWQSTPYQLTPGVYCGNTTIGGNGTTDVFAPGTYYIVNGNLVFNNALVTTASGVAFILTGSSPGSFQWTNYSGSFSMTAPTTGSLAGILVWQTCNTSKSDPANTFNGGSTLQITGSIYTPCGALDLNNNAQLKATTGTNFGVVAQSIYTTGSAGLATNASSGGSSSGVTIALTQ